MTRAEHSERAGRAFQTEQKDIPMAILKFSASAVAAQIALARACKTFLPSWNGPVDRPALILFVGNGVHLRSNGIDGTTTRIVTTEQADPSFAFADGMNPFRDTDWMAQRRMAFRDLTGQFCIDILDDVQVLIDRGRGAIRLATDGSTCQIVTATHYRRGRQKRRCYLIEETGGLVRLSRASLAGSELLSSAKGAGSPVLAEYLAGRDEVLLSTVHLPTRRKQILRLVLTRQCKCITCRTQQSPPLFQETAITALAQDVSKLTDRYQTTVPASVRKQLKLGKGDQIRYCTEPSGRVYIEPVRSEEEDPVLGAFLDFVEADIKAHPDRIRAFDGALHDRLAALVGDVEVDLDAPLSLEDE